MLTLRLYLTQTLGFSLIASGSKSRERESTLILLSLVHDAIFLVSDKKMAPKRPDYEGSDGESYGRPSKRSRMMEKDTDEYQKRRERNNIAVKKSRERSRQKAKETIEQVNRLRAENEMLEQKVEILSKELSVLKDLFLAHAGSVAQSERAIEATESRAPIPDHQYSSSKQKQ